MRELPLQRYELFRSGELDLVRDTVGHVFAPLRLELIGTDTRLDAWLRTRRLRDLAINFICYGGNVHIEPGPLGTFFVIQIPLSGTAEVRCGDRHVHSTPELATVISPSEPLTMIWSADCVQLVCRIERPALEAHLTGIIGAPLHQPLRFELAMDVTAGTGLSLKAALTALADELDRPDGLINYPIVAHEFERAMMTALLLAQPNNYTAKINGEQPVAPSRVVGIALELIESHPERPHTTASLAREAGVSMRSLQLAFHDQLNTSAMAYLKHTRLRRVHSDLRAAEPDATTVAGIAARWGFMHGGHFASAYRQAFGENPAQTLRR